MPRPTRVFVEGGVYHVYNRIARGEDRFRDEREAQRFVDLLREIKQRDELTVFAWCLMSSHYHLAVRTSATPLARSMKSVQYRFTREFNARKDASGSQWHSRYKAKLVQDPRYLDQLLVYIHLNPVQAGLVDDPVDYAWSGHRELMGKVADPLVNVDDVLAVYGGDRRSARRAYLKQLQGAREEEWLGEGPGRLPWWKLGRPPSRKDEDEVPDARVTACIDILGRSTGLERPRLDVQQFLEEGTAQLGVTLDELASRTRRDDVVRAREMLTALGAERYGLKVKELAAAMLKSPGACSFMATRGIERRGSDESFRKRMDALDRHFAGVKEASTRKR